MIPPAIARRHRERAEWLELAHRYVGLLDDLAPHAVVVFGSVARGDFNRWSDLDVLVVVDELPDSPIERYATLRHGDLVGVQPIGWTVAEFAARRRRGDPIAREADTTGVVVAGSLPR